MDGRSAQNVGVARSAALALVLAAALGLVAAGRAFASDPFPVQENFAGATFGSQWRDGGSAELTGGGEAEGWLRLTSAAGGEFGYAYDDEAFPSADGALVEFEYADWGGSGADGLTFFLFNGATSEAEFHAGQPGGSLGYASCNNSSDGLTNAYVGVGFDEYGNFTNLGSICGLDGTEFLPDHVSVRGSAAEDYRLLATAATSESLRAERSQARRVTIAVTPAGKLSVYVRYPDGTYQKVTEGFQLPAAPEKLKFGYVASTGALTDDHEIRGAQVTKPTQLTPTVAQTRGGHERGEALTWTAVVRNEGPNPTQKEAVHATTGGESLAGVSWTCEADGGAECATTAGVGLPSQEAGAMPEGSGLTYKITGTPGATTDYAQMTVESEPRGDTGELDPELERTTTKTDLTPLFEEQPSFTLAGDGEASAGTVSALGGEISYGYWWERCEADGKSCTEIAGAEKSTYQTTAADLGHTIRFTETATNGAGSTTIDSEVYKPLPGAEITAAPARYVASGAAKLAFAGSTPEATLECSFDGQAWSECGSPVSYGGLADGEHTFDVRAVYGGLSSPEAASVQWTVEATPSAPSILSAPASPTVQADAAFQFGGLVEGGALECELDGGEWRSCGASAEFTDLAGGQHELQARQVNRAGVDSGVTSYGWTIAAVTLPEAPVVTSEAQDKAAECALARLSAACTPGSNVASPSEASHTPAVQKRTGAGAAKHRSRSGSGRAGKAGKHKDAGGRGHKTKNHRPAAAKQNARRHRQAAKRRRNAKEHRHAAAKHEAKKRRHATKHRHKAKRHRHAAKHRHEAKKHGDAAKHGRGRNVRRGTKTQRTASGSHPGEAGTRRDRAGAKGSPPAAKHKPAVGTVPVEGPPAPADEAPEAAQEPKTTPPAQTRRRAATAPSPTPTPQPPVSTGTRTPKGEPPGQGAGPRRHLKTRAPAKPTLARKHKGKTHAPTAKHEAASKRQKATAKRKKQRFAAERKKHRPATKHKAGSKKHKRTTRRSHRAAARGKSGVAAIPVIRPFGPRSTAVVGRALRLVERVAAALRRARRVVCIGYTDDLGAQSYNVTLSLKRAEAVCTRLRALGVHATFKAEGRGAEHPCASNATPRGRALNRRVELRVALK
jgi:outer membrane protein OmpA-like peptidoglycan-associated protein